jgi:hypothetical protein
MYDLTGDVHGYASELKALLAKMDYQVTDGIWKHPVRKVIFLGDFVDLGSKQIETVHIARTMVESGNALAVMGNHEYYAVAWATPDPQNPNTIFAAAPTKTGTSTKLSWIRWARAVNCITAWLNGSKPCRFTSTCRNYAPFTPVGTQST